MAASFPGSVKNFGADRVNGDYIPASDTNDLRFEVAAVETMLLSGGWISPAETWTYASATTFTVAGDLTAVYTRGARLRWRQGAGFRYAVAAGSTYAAPNTTVTLVASTDYPLLNQAVTEPGYSYLGEPRGWPTWFNYTVALTGFAVDPGTLISKYSITGRTVNVYHNEGTAGTSNATIFTVSMPVLPNTGGNLYYPLALTVDNGANQASGVIRVNNGSLVADLFKSAVTAWTAAGGKRAGFALFYEW